MNRGVNNVSEMGILSGGSPLPSRSRDMKKMFLAALAALAALAGLSGSVGLAQPPAAPPQRPITEDGGAPVGNNQNSRTAGDTGPPLPNATTNG